MSGRLSLRETSSDGFRRQAMEKENDILGLEHDIYDKVRESMDKNQREYYLSEQIKAINIQRALINEEQRANDCDYVIPESATAPGSPDGSYVVGEINGSYEKLPA